MSHWGLRVTAWNNLGLRIAGGIIVASVLSLVWTSSSYAVSGTGYFTTSKTYTADPVSISLNDVLSGSSYDSSIPGRDPTAFAVPSYIANNAGNDREQLYDWLRSKAAPDGQLTSNRDEVGISFIVHTMLGDPPGGTRRLYASDWTELYNRLVRNPGLDIYSVTADPNAYGNGRISFSNNGGTDDFFASYNSGSRPLIVIEDASNDTRYVIERYCANPVGGLSLPPYFWGVNGSSSANVSTAYPGNTITWTHVLRNNMSGTNTTATVEYHIRKIVSGVSTTVSSDSDIDISSGGSRTYTLTYVVQPGDVGKSICQDINWNWHSLLDHSWQDSTNACVTIIEPYELDPYINNHSTDEWKTVDQAVTVQPTVDNSGGSSLSSVHWEITKYYVTPGAYTKSAVISGNSPTTNYSAANVYNLQARFRQGDRVFSGGVTNLASFTYDVEGLPYGTRVCFALSVQPYKTGSTRWKHSAPYCVLVGKTPSAQVWGNDIRVGSPFLGRTGQDSSLIKGKVATNGTNYFGTWSEYGLVAPSNVVDVASSSGLNSATSSNKTAWSKLTFTNTTTPNYGNFATASSLGTLPDVIGYLDNGSFSAGVNVVTHPGTINQWRPNWGQNVIVDARGSTITIGGDIVAPSAFSSFTAVSGMPQMIIIANNINIQKTVSRIDAWLIALDTGAANTGTINTCSNAPSRPSVDACDTQLRINGPVIAKNLLMYRTYGSDRVATLNRPAEIIDLSAGSYIWAQNQAKLSGGLRTISVRELPPRY